MFLSAVVFCCFFFVCLLCFFCVFVLYLFSNFITVLGLFKFYPLIAAELSSCINDCVTCLYQFPDPAKVSDPVVDYILSLHQHFFDSPNNVCKQTSFVGDLFEDDPCCQCNHMLCLSSVLMLSRVVRTFFKECMLSMVLRTTPWSKSSSYSFDVDDGGCFGCCCSSCAFFFSSTIF